MTNPKFPYPVTVPSERALELVAVANFLAKDEWAPQFEKEKTTFWFASQSKADSFLLAFFSGAKL
ncbi:hypothetical protein FJN17_07765 [Bradyrhizobium symbiodeficiens]|uniref:Uncharacterized protein n=1 Tax=Bradyrhizobium symbiodeficiens TaxID=1404367 RepID=A0ABX5W2H7_9BRAD|nr:hypothetical protein [Bradyrhizobium symbiodeficiens]QDF37473.1 hypothetical protein FJN17_07765 [Bradyrhizobium symbiodeficiens]